MTYHTTYTKSNTHENPVGSKNPHVSTSVQRLLNNKAAASRVSMSWKQATRMTLPETYIPRSLSLLYRTPHKHHAHPPSPNTETNLDAPSYTRHIAHASIPECGKMGMLSNGTHVLVPMHVNTHTLSSTHQPSLPLLPPMLYSIHSVLSGIPGVYAGEDQGYPSPKLSPAKDFLTNCKSHNMGEVALERNILGLFPPSPCMNS